MKRILLFLFAVIIGFFCLQCSSQPKEEAKEKATAAESESLQSAKSTEGAKIHQAPASKPVSKDSFDLKIGDSLATFFKALPDLKPYIHPAYGVTCLEPGPGVYPLRSVLEDEADAMGKTHFMYLVRDFHIISKSVFTPLPNDFSYCEEIKDGFYFMEAPKDLLSAAYRLEQGNIGEEPEAKELKKWTMVDKAMTRTLIVCFHTPMDEEVKFKLIFGNIDGKMYLLVLDLRDCGA